MTTAVQLPRRLAALALLALSACGRLEPNRPTLTSRIDEISLAGLRAPPGLSEHTLVVAGKRRRFGLWLPPDGPEGARPVILFLHGAQRHPSFRFLQGFVEPALAPLGPIVIAPEAPSGRGGEWWRGEEASYALGLLRAALLRWKIDDRRVAVMGYSNGGIGTWVFARAYPQYFTAAVPMAFNHTVVGPTPLPIFAIQGEKDELFGSAQVAEAVERLQAEGYDVTLAIRKRGSHFRPGSYGEQLEQARRWLETVWKRATSPAGPD